MYRCPILKFQPALHLPYEHLVVHGGASSPGRHHRLGRDPQARPFGTFALALQLSGPE